MSDCFSCSTSVVLVLLLESLSGCFSAVVLYYQSFSGLEKLTADSTLPIRTWAQGVWVMWVASEPDKTTTGTEEGTSVPKRGTIILTGNLLIKDREFQ